MKEIAKEHNVEWDTSESEKELLKPKIVEPPSPSSPSLHRRWRHTNPRWSDHPNMAKKGFSWVSARLSLPLYSSLVSSAFYFASTNVVDLRRNPLKMNPNSLNRHPKVLSAADSYPSSWMNSNSISFQGARFAIESLTILCRASISDGI